ncbi:MAG: glycosyltransferase, partial [Candidatus Bathyarchaeia archaeon]
TTCVRVIPNGVPKSEIAKSPSIKVRRGKPRIGFIGTIASWVDIGLVFTVAEKMPDCEFVLAGDGPNYRFWRQNPPTNVCFVGRVPMAKRGEFVSSLDVGLIPFKRVSLADSAYPLKLLEYFARGVPVVSSPLVETKRIADGLAYFADGVDAWTAQINKALTDSFARRLSYIDFARKHTWENTARTLLEIIAEKSTVRAVCTC